LSVVYFTKYFRQYLLSRKFYIRTDHAALSWLKRTPEPIGQNARWMQILSEYDFDIAHRKGRSRANADALSRHPCLNKPSCTACHPEKEGVVRAVTAMDAPESNVENCQQFSPFGAADQSTDRQLPISAGSDVTATSSEPHTEPEVPEQHGWNVDELIEAQKKDPTFSFIIRLLSEKSTKPVWKEIELQSADVKNISMEWNRLSLRDGLLCRKWVELNGNVVW